MYQKPSCECGCELTYYNQEVYDVERDITKRGKLKEKSRYFIEIGSYSPYGAMLECKNKYDLEYDEKRRVIRGDIRDSY